MSEAERNEPIIIRRRRDDGDEDHHGGVWKLAFADFMTAMMAFFLVMWLINSTSKETKAVIVQYFNPVQLVDSSPAHKGLRDPAQSGQGKSLQKTDSPEKPAEQRGSQEQEAALHTDPLKALDEIAKREPAPVAAEGAAQSQPGAALTPRDPFDRVASGARAASNRAETVDAPPDAAAPPPAKEADRSPSEKAKSTAAAALQSALEKIIKQEALDLRAIPHVEVKQTDEGVMISLTDDANFSMFAVGSIEPRPQLVRILGRIGKTLAKQSGEVEIRGHTDGRSYANSSYDNWRLSSDRATMVNYMLIRGGLPQTRVGKIVGFADRRLKTPKDPLAAVNRRIEILLRGE